MEQPKPEGGGAKSTCWQCGNQNGPANQADLGRSRWLSRRYVTPPIVCVVCASIILTEPDRRADTEAPKRYVTTVWTRTYDFDGLVEEFAVLGESAGTLHQAVEHLFKSAGQLVSEDLAQHPKWTCQPFDDYKRGFCQVNQHNTVVARDETKIGDGTVHNSRYYYFETIEVPGEQPVDETLFIRDGKCPWEITDYFKQHKTTQLS